MRKLALLFIVILITTGLKPLQTRTVKKTDNPEKNIRAMLSDSLMFFKTNFTIEETTNEQNNDLFYIDNDNTIRFLDPITKEKHQTESLKPEESTLHLKSGISFQVKISHRKNAIVIEDLRSKGEEIAIDFTKDQVKIGDRKLSFDKKLVVDSNQNAFNSAWTGYSWKGDNNKDQLNLGRLENGSTFIYIKTRNNAKEDILIEEQKKATKTPGH